MAIRTRAARASKAGAAVEQELPPARVTANLPAPVWRDFTKWAQRQGITRTEALRRAVWVYVYFMRRIREDGCEIVLEKPDGERERLLFPY